MSGRIVDGATLTAPTQIEADAVVVGTGAGGGMAFRELAKAGLRVVALEAGGYRTSSEFNQREDDMLPMLFQDGGGQSTSDLAIRVLQGRGVGGSTVHNTNLCKRTPDAILELWQRRYGVSGASAREMAPLFDEIERELSVTEIGAAQRNTNNEMLRIGAEALGYRAGPLKHNRVGCLESGFCELGCSFNAKQNSLKLLVPDALERGGDLYANVSATRLIVKEKRVVGVEATLLDNFGRPRGTVDVRAPIVVLAASAVGSAVLLKRSGIDDPYNQAGRGLRLHPGAAVAGRFTHEIAGFKGIPQSYECTEFLDFDDPAKRVWIVPAFAHPVGTASALTGFGAAHMSAMRTYRHIACLTAMVHDETSGVVDVTSDGGRVISYTMTESDSRQLARGLIECARILFAAGAAEVTIPAIPSLRFSSAKELDKISPTFAKPHAVPITSVHPMGTLRMGDNPESSSVNSQGEHHQIKGLFVADGSIFPTSLGAPPQISIYTFAKHLSRNIVSRAREL